MAKNVKRILALLVFACPCLVYYISVRLRARDALLFTLPALWCVVLISFVAAVFSYIVLCKGASSETADADEEEYDGSFEVSERSEDGVSTEDYSMEYPELFSSPKQEEETENTYDMSAQIAAVIGAQKNGETADFAEESIPDDDWRAFIGCDNEEKGDSAAITRELYGTLSEEMPEGYVPVEAEEETEAEFFSGYSVRPSSFGETALSKAVFVGGALLAALLIAASASFSVVAEGKDGFAVGKREYKWEMVTDVTVSQKLFGSLSVEVRTDDGRKTELLPSTLIGGADFDDEYESIYEYAAYAVRRSRAAGADVKVRDRETLTAAWRDSEDGSWKYISEIID